MRKFWMVIGLKSTQTSKRHYTYPEAFNEAERLVKQTGEIFILLEAMEYCGPKEILVEWQDLKRAPNTA